MPFKLFKPHSSQSRRPGRIIPYQMIVLAGLLLVCLALFDYLKVINAPLIKQVRA